MPRLRELQLLMQGRPALELSLSRGRTRRLIDRWFPLCVDR